MSVEARTSGSPSRQDTNWLLLGAGVALAALLVAIWLWLPPEDFDPKAWQATAPDRRLIMAQDFKRHWEWRGASRAQLVSWLGEPEAEGQGATWWLSQAPGNPAAEAHGVSICFRPGGPGRDTLATIDGSLSAPGPLQPFSPAAWAAGGEAERSAMFVSLRQTVRNLDRIDHDALRALLGQPAHIWTSFQLSAGTDMMDDCAMVVHLENDKAIGVDIIGR